MAKASDELIARLQTCAPKVYFKPPAKSQLDYPCIVVEKKYADQKYADNRNYSTHIAYQILVMDTVPDGDIQAKVIEEFNMLHWDNDFTADGIYHSAFTLFYRI